LRYNSVNFIPMAVIRFSSLEKINTRKPIHVKAPSREVTDYFGINVFDDRKMRKFLSQDAYDHVQKAIFQGTPIDRKMADAVAIGMKAWAVEQGATHYTHWFQPLTGGTAEKHDAFLDYSESGVMVESFSGKALAQQEPDASSFPSGGLRNTFEARGYTAWDPSSPAFVIGDTLSIPTIFISYTGEALDHKTPLLRALNAIDAAATEVCQYFDKNVTKVQANLGWEQEYFLVDEALYYARPDLALTGRTLMGHASAKDQQLDDHYFSSIPERVSAFMKELEFEAYKLGIPVKTRHNEVAPNQYEIATLYNECNLAVDQNVLTMELMKRISRHHGFRVLFHEKPFKDVNGSGKHNNWSLMTDTGVILHSPGKNPKSNLQFLTFVVNTIKAVYDHQDLFRASILTASNSHRLGANEAPPAILSCFLGSEVSKMLDQIEEQVTNRKMTPDEKTELKLDIGKIPEILLDNTDRNRTSPFAFTGNRFEYRAVGSSSNCATPMAVLNAAVAAQLREFSKSVEKLVAKNVKKDEAIFQVLREQIIASKAIRFEGDNYSESWLKEARKRGLTNITDIPESIRAFLSESTKKLFVSQGILSESELEARVEVMYENYIMKIQIEARVLGDLAINHIVPTAVKYQNVLMENVSLLKGLYGEEYIDLAGNRVELIREISDRVTAIKSLVNEMVEARSVANKISAAEKRAQAYSKTVFSYLDKIRYHIDKLELIVDDEMWPLPKYRELLFSN